MNTNKGLEAALAAAIANEAQGASSIQVLCAICNQCEQFGASASALAEAIALLEQDIGGRRHHCIETVRNDATANDLLDNLLGASASHTPPSASKVQQVAHAFVVYLALTIGPDMEEVRRLNEHVDDGVCCTHDFCDANMVMHAAMRAMGCSADLQSDEYVDLNNAAWSLARRVNFDIMALEVEASPPLSTDMSVSQAFAIVVNAPQFFADPAFMAWLNDKTAKFTWHTQGQAVADEYSDVVVTVDPTLNGEGSDSDMPASIWEFIVSLCREQLGARTGVPHYMVRLTNLAS